VKYAWIATQRRDYPLPALCTTLAVSGSGYRAWERGGKPDRRRLTDAQLLALICAIHAELKGSYGRSALMPIFRVRQQNLRASGGSGSLPST
jgi:putative transposase